VAFTIEANQTRWGQFDDSAAAPSLPSADDAPGAFEAPPAATSEQEYRVRRPIRGLLTNHGYMLPDPNVANRMSIWFSGGTLECHRDEDLDEWRRLFDSNDLPRRDLGEMARVLAAKVLLGATVTTAANNSGSSSSPPSDAAEGDESDDGCMSYQLRRPIGGHGQVFCDVLYADEDFRVLRGHHGTVYVHRRVPATPA
jgi:hypothetical protein